MILFSSETTDPYLNIALEEVLLRQGNDEYVLLYINDPSVVVGKHQVSHREVNTEYLHIKGIPLIRRISGGGTVYHDAGNLNYTFITNAEEGKQVDFLKHTAPIIAFLSSVGVDACLGGRNDIRVDDLKISGSAEHVFRNRVLHHGTLLFSASLGALSGAIRKDKSSYLTRAVDSNPSLVVNISEITEGFHGIGNFRSALEQYLITSMPGLERGNPGPGLLEKTAVLAQSKYRSWEWNYAYGPEYFFNNSFEINGVAHSCSFKVRDGLISGPVLDGSPEFRDLTPLLEGCRHMVPELAELFLKENPVFPGEAIYNFF